MSTSDQLAAAVGAPSAPVAKPKTKAPAIVQQVLSDQFKKQLALAVPKHLSADRMARIAATELRKTPDLLDTTPASFMGAVMQSAQLGLEPGSALGQAYLVPFNKKNQKTGKWYKECQLILGYRGMIDLARRSGQVLSLSAFAVHEGDDFSYQLGLHPDIHHVPSCDAGRIKKPIIFVYAVANLKGGGCQFEVMSRAEVEAVKTEAKSKNVWDKYFEAMALKTVIRRLFKYLPVSIEALQVANVDAKREAGDEIKPEDVIDINAISVEDFKDIDDAEVVGTSQDTPVETTNK
ncbi:recombinase RecT [Parasutterella excrementihominis]|uniref:recombinase RecT n=1 Tax=Parasutterella excrementihominis TaxID=487175 RepID=UPI0022E080E8|nr:recombinase RecT [Parasutterella excrementihominis]